MAIIIEGMDNSGKSTLAASFGLEIVHPGPRPSTWQDVLKCLDNQLAMCHRPIVMDRVTSISQPCYTGKYDPIYAQYLNGMLSTQNCVLIYCRPPIQVIRDFSRHVPKSYDDEAKLKWLIANVDQIVDRYDSYMACFPHKVWDYTNVDMRVFYDAVDSLSFQGAWEKWTHMNRR